MVNQKLSQLFRSRDLFYVLYALNLAGTQNVNQCCLCVGLNIEYPKPNVVHTQTLYCGQLQIEKHILLR